MSARFLVLLAFAAFAGCSSAALKSGDSGDSVASGSRTSEYEALKASVAQYHDRSIAGPDKPWVFSGETDETYYKTFADSYCLPIRGKAIPASVCGRRFMDLVTSILARTYFAANLNSIQQKCSEDPLICGDLQTLEVLFRRQHNAGIEESKREKLAALEDWSRKKLTDRELESSLHMNFKFDDGKLTITIPREDAS
jgi:hypothetical protein